MQIVQPHPDLFVRNKSQRPHVGILAPRFLAQQFDDNFG